jgi:hypothetical protein
MTTMTTTNYKPRFSRDGEGRYLCVYGRGKKAVKGALVQCPDSTEWIIREHGPDNRYALLRDAKAAWGEWAARTYHGTAEPEPAIERPDDIPPPPTYEPARFTADVPDDVAGAVAELWDNRFDPPISGSVSAMQYAAKTLLGRDVGIEVVATAWHNERQRREGLSRA